MTTMINYVQEALPLMLYLLLSMNAEGAKVYFHGELVTARAINVTDIGIREDDGGTTAGRPLICQSELTGGNWYLHPEDESTAGRDRIESEGDRGWYRSRDTTDSHNRVILKRVAATGALEGRFTCWIRGDINTTNINILYLISSVNASIVVVSGRDREFKVQCRSTGGRALSMTVSGPDGYNSDLTSNIQPVGDQRWIGSDNYTATTIVIAGGSNGDVYQCTVTSAASNTGSVRLTVASAPVITLLESTTLNAVRVEWTQPNPARVEKFDVLILLNGALIAAQHEVSTSRTAVIPGLTAGLTYTVSVEAISQHLSGVSEEMSITLAPAVPQGVVARIADSTTVRVSWEAVTNADRYTVTFTRATGEQQEGLCLPSSHTANLAVDAPTTTANIDIGENVLSSDSHMLRAYSTYFIIVQAENNGGSSEGSEQESILTPQIGATIASQDVVSTAQSSTEISVQWSQLMSPCRAINGQITSYRIQYTAQPNGRPQTTDQTQGLEITLTGLTPFTNYSIEVAAVNEEGDVGVYSEPEFVETQETFPSAVRNITSVPFFFKITVMWKEPAMPNGIIREYEVCYRLTDIMQYCNSTGMKTNFTTPADLELGKEFNITVKAYTSVGPGEPTSVKVSTLHKPTAVRVEVVPVNGTSVNVSWNSLIIPNIPIDTYTVAYSPVSQDSHTEEKTSVFPGSASSAIITGLDPALDYQFQVFATVTEDGKPVEGQRSNITVTTSTVVTVYGADSVVTIYGQKSESGYHDSPKPIIIIIIISIGLTIIIAILGLIATAVLMIMKIRNKAMAKRGNSEVMANENVAYGVIAPPNVKQREESTGEYAVPECLKLSSTASPEHIYVEI